MKCSNYKLMAIPAAASAVAALIVASGCKVGPDYQRPEMLVPTTYASTRPTTVPTSQPLAAAELTKWWEQLGDAQLTSLIDRATKANLDLRVAASRVREAKAARGVSAAAGQPQANANGAYARQRTSDNVTNRQGGEDDFYNAGFDASWEVDLFGGLKRAVEASDAQILLSIETQRDVLVSVQAEVASNYALLRYTQKRLEVATNAVRVQRESADLARSRFNAGLVSEVDVTRADAQVATTESQIPSFEATIRGAMYRLGVLLGVSPSALTAELETQKPIPLTPPEIPPGQPGDLLLRRPDIRAAEASLWAATANIGVAKSDLYPKFSLLGNIGLQSNTLHNWWDADSRAWSIGPQVSWSVLNGGRVNANIEVQNARQEQAMLRYQQTILSGVEEVENSLTQYGTEQRRRETLQRAVDANQRSVDLARELYTRGLADFTTVLDAERALYINQDLLVLSQGSVTTDAIAVYKALGGGWLKPNATIPAPATLPAAK